MTSSPVAKRIGNKRGFGSNLREEIVAAAERLLAEQGSGAAVTLRAIAREAGIAAPSIYPHFSDRDAILDEVVARSFQSLGKACQAAADSASPGIDRVQAISEAYVGFARDHPGRYRILFERSSANISALPRTYREGIRAFDLLVQALAYRGVERSPGQFDAVVAAQGLFATLHGIATLQPALPGFPWIGEAALVRDAALKTCR